MDADAVAARLYRVPPGEFVAARDDAAGRTREAGDEAAAREIAALRRPTRAAWLTNLLVDAAPEEVEGLLALAGPLAEAQRSLDGPALRQVSAQRTKLVGALARRAARLGREAGQRVDSGLEREVRGVLESALADDELAERVRSGRLVRFERHSGFGTLGTGGDDEPDSSGPVSGRASTGSGRDSGGAAGHGAAGRQEREREAAEQRERERREQALADAEDRLEQARLAAHDAARERDDARERADAAAEHRDEAHQRVDDLRAELERARAGATGSDRALKSAEREAADTARRARQADTEVTRAEQALDEARDS